MKLLIDTGATVSILAINIYETLIKSLGGRQNLGTLNGEILPATNEPLKVSGKTELTIQFGS